MSDKNYSFRPLKPPVLSELHKTHGQPAFHKCILGATLKDSSHNLMTQRSPSTSTIAIKNGKRNHFSPSRWSYIPWNIRAIMTFMIIHSMNSTLDDNSCTLSCCKSMMKYLIMITPFPTRNLLNNSVTTVVDPLVAPQHVQGTVPTDQGSTLNKHKTQTPWQKYQEQQSLAEIWFLF